MNLPDSAFDLSAHLQRSLGTEYTLERELSGGGMSRVFVATKSALGRRVVVKVLTPELAEGISLERFAREIRLLASLQQANIVPLLSAGRTGELPYYTMPMVEGRSLSDRIRQVGALSNNEAINILRDVARALAYAHEHGIVHRDIKPDNILLSSGTAVVADFGIAKAISTARTQDIDTKLTQTGTGIGTVAYMAPEQAVGDPNVDHRADIYAFGCVAYEVLTGLPPFAGRALHQVVAAHLQETPRALTVICRDVAPTLSTMVAQCLEKDPAKRPQSARELLQVLDGNALVAQPRRQRPISRMAVAEMAVALMAIGGGGWYAWQHRSMSTVTSAAANVQPLSLAVLPFENVGDDSVQEYLADGIGDEIATALGKTAGLRIIGRNAAFQYHNQRNLNLRDVERTLGAQYVLQGSLRQNRDSLIVTAQLTDSTGGASIWSHTFERKVSELSGIPIEISRAVADTLRKKFASGVTVQARAPDRSTTNAEAYDLFMLGEYLLKQRGAGVHQSIGNFENAIALDPKFARAYAGLSSTLVLVPYYDGTPASEVLARATNAAHRALELDSTLAEPHTALAIAYWHQTQPDSAEAEFRRAIAIEPNDLNSHFQYGRFLVTYGRSAEAAVQFALASNIDPLSALNSSWAAYNTFLSGDHVRALKEIERATLIDSTILPTANFRGLIYLAAGRTADARAVMQRIPVDASMSYAAYVYAAIGDTAAANGILRKLDARDPRPWFVDAVRGTMKLARGDTAAALDAFEQSTQKTGVLWTSYILLNDRLYDPIRNSPRFRALLKSARMNEKLFTGSRGAALP